MSPKALTALRWHVLCRYCTLRSLFNMTPWRHRGSLEKTSRELEPTQSLSPPSHSLPYLHLHSFSFVFISALYVWFYMLFSWCFLSLFFFLSSLSFFLQPLPVPLFSLALLVWLLLTLFLSWLPAHSFLYACMLTNGCGRCSPRCL